MRFLSLSLAAQASLAWPSVMDLLVPMEEFGRYGILLRLVYALSLAFLGIQAISIHLTMWFMRGFSPDSKGGSSARRLKETLGLFLAIVMVATAILVIVEIRDFRRASVIPSP